MIFFSSIAKFFKILNSGSMKENFTGKCQNNSLVHTVPISIQVDCPGSILTSDFAVAGLDEMK